MASTREEEKPWKTDLARKSALRRESVLHEVEEAIKKAFRALFGDHGLRGGR